MLEGQFIWSVLTINLIHDTKIQVPVMVRSREKAFHVFKNLLDRPDFKLGDITDPIYIKRFGRCGLYYSRGKRHCVENIYDEPSQCHPCFGGRYKNILELAKEEQCKSVVSPSSMKVYRIVSLILQHRVVEDEWGYIDCSSIRSCYPESKRLCENMCICYSAHMAPQQKLQRWRLNGLLLEKVRSYLRSLMISERMDMRQRLHCG